MSEAQKVIKYFAVAFAISLIASIFLGIYYAGNIIGDVLIENSREKGLNIHEFASNANILNINLRASKLIIKEGTTLKVENKNQDIQVEQDLNKLSIEEKKHNLFKDSNNREVVVYIPENMIFDKVYIANGAGVIDIDKLRTKELSLELGAGEITLHNLDVQNKTTIDSGAGEVRIDNALLNNLDLDVGIGEFTLNGEVLGTSEIDAGIGELNVSLSGGKETYKIKAEKGLGSIKIDNVEYKDEIIYGEGMNEIEIDGGIGSIDIRFN